MERRNKMRVWVPEGERGPWKVERFVVDQRDAMLETIRAMQHGRGCVAPDTYTRLTYHGKVWMSDTNDEIRDLFGLRRHARGRVLIHGLGLGVAVQMALLEPEVEHVLVVELEQDVIDLVAPHYLERFGRDRLEIRQGNAFDWPIPKGARWDVVWHDIWADLRHENLREMHRLHRRFGRRASWQGSWGRDWLETHSR
jgi:hypothetical protein